MKLRQKLAVVLASAMVLTAVPVVTMADSTNNKIGRASCREEVRPGVNLGVRLSTTTI